MSNYDDHAKHCRQSACDDARFNLGRAKDEHDRSIPVWTDATADQKAAWLKRNEELRGDGSDEVRERIILEWAKIYVSEGITSCYCGQKEADGQS